MKRTIALVAFFIIVTGYAHAQTSAGNMMVGGALRIYSSGEQSNDDYDYSEFQFAPSFGYFISDNFAIGLNLAIATRKQDNGFALTKYTDFSAGPFARYYKFTSNEQFAFFAQASINFGTGTIDVTPGGETKTSSLNFNVSPGFAYFFNNHWAAELSFSGLSVGSYDPNKDVDDDKNTYVVFDIRSFSPSIGARYHFGGGD
jgi:outer membrane protein